MKKTAINTFTTYTESREIDSEHAAGMFFKNEGNTTCLINGMLSLAPGASWSVGQTCCDTLDETMYSVQFLPLANQAITVAAPSEEPFTTSDIYNKLVVVKIGIAKQKC